MDYILQIFWKFGKISIVRVRRSGPPKVKTRFSLFSLSGQLKLIDPPPFQISNSQNLRSRRFGNLIFVFRPPEAKILRFWRPKNAISKGETAQNKSRFFKNFASGGGKNSRYDVFLHVDRRRRKFCGFGPLKMRFLKGKSPRKELKFENFRAAGAPIWGFFDHNPNFSKKGG